MVKASLRSRLKRTTSTQLERESGRWLALVRCAFCLHSLSAADGHAG